MASLITNQVLRCRPIFSLCRNMNHFSRLSTFRCVQTPNLGCGNPASLGIFKSHLRLQQKTAPAPVWISAMGFRTGSKNDFYEDKETKTLAVWKNLKELRASPLPALSFGLAGLIPFVAAPMYMVTEGLFLPHIAFAQLAYGACILSFLGGVRWGFVLPDESVVQPNWFNLGYSVAPSLIAWTGLIMPHTPGMLTVITGLGFSAYMDLSMYGYPSWFKGLRFLLSFFAILSLWSTFMCKIVMKTEKEAPVTVTY